MHYKISHLTLRHVSVKYLVVTLVVLGVFALVPAWQHKASADYQAQINALSAQNAANRATLNDLAAVAASYQDAISKLQSQIDALQAAIDKNTAEQTRLQQEIAAAQAELERQKGILASDIKQMYVDGIPSALEMVATSKDLSEFVDKQEYRSRVQNKIQTTMVRIAELEKQLQAQKTRVEALIKEQQVQQAALNDDRAKQQELLAMNQSQQSEYNARISSNSQRIAQLQAEQVALIRRASAGSRVVANSGNDTYPAPWRNAPLNAYVDDWGMFSRQCVSYTAWKVHEAYGNMPTWGFVYRSNANNWDDLARGAGIPTGYTPKVGSVGIINAGEYGHAVWIEAVEGSQVLVSEYNYDWAGGFRRAYYPASSFVYIYFGER